MITISEGKLKSLEAVSNKKGIISAAAMDQRGSLQKSIAKARGVSDKEITPAMMSEFKIAVTKVLTPYASAILLDPEFGLPAAKARSKNAGLLLAYEKTGYDATGPGRIPTFLDGYSAKRLKEEGADCVKVLLYYSPFDDPKVNQKKKEVVIKSMEEFSKDKYKVDVLKVEIPIDVKYLKGSKAFNGKEIAYDWDEAKAIFKRQDRS